MHAGEPGGERGAAAASPALQSTSRHALRDTRDTSDQAFSSPDEPTAPAVRPTAGGPVDGGPIRRVDGRVVPERVPWSPEPVAVRPVPEQVARGGGEGPPFGQGRAEGRHSAGDRRYPVWGAGGPVPVGAASGPAGVRGTVGGAGGSGDHAREAGGMRGTGDGDGGPAHTAGGTAAGDADAPTTAGRAAEPAGGPAGSDEGTTVLDRPGGPDPAPDGPDGDPSGDPDVDPDPGGAPTERLVLTLADGPTLREITAGAPMRPAEVARIGAELATVLAHQHQRGRPHGAVSPANVVVTRGGQPQLVDVGTDSGARPADDVHDLGLVLLTALNGSESGVVPTGIPRTLRRVLLAATDADPARRPTARQMVDMLAWVARDGAAAGPERPSGAGRTTWVVAAGAALVVLLGLSAVAVLRENPDLMAGPAAVPTTEPAPTPSAEPAPEPSPAPTAEAPPAEPVAPPTEIPAVPETPVLPTALPTAPPTELPGVLPTALPTELPSVLPTVVPTDIPGIDLPTALPELPEVPDLPAEADGLWDRFVDWVKGLF